MRIFRKALSLVLALALAAGCIPALAGSVFAEASYDYYDVTGNNAITLHGVSYDSENGVFARMDLTSAAAQNGYNNGIHTYSGTVYWHMRESAGGRIRLGTDSSTVAINATLRSWNSQHYATNMAAAKYGFDIYVDTVNGSVYAGTVKASDADIAAAKTKWTSNETDNVTTTSTNAQMSELTVSGTVDLSSFTPVNGQYNLTIYFPITMETKQVQIGVEAGKTVTAHAIPYANAAPVVFYGSSITQGGVSTQPGNAYTAVASRLLNADYHSFGMWGSCNGQENVAQYIASLDMSVFVLDYDHNDTQATSFGPKQLKVYQIVRQAHPEIPIIMISRPNRAMTYNASQDSIENMKAAILDNFYASIENDPNLHFIDGEAFFNYDGSLPTDETYKYNKVFLSDGTHPTNAGQAAMAAVVANVISLANSGIKNIYVDKDEFSFGGNAKEDILFDSTDAVNAMTQADWSNGTVSGKALVLTNSQTATLQAKNADKWSGYTAIADLTVAFGASATITIGGKTLTLSQPDVNGCTVTVEGVTRRIGVSYPITQNANGSYRLVIGLTLENDQFAITVNGTEDFFRAGVMGGAPSFGADGGQVTVNALLITAPTQRAYYTAALNDKIGLNIHMSLSEAAAANTGSYMVFTFNGEDSAPLPLPAPEKDGTYAFSFQVAAKEMADDIVAAFYSSDGTLIARHTTSIKDYASYIVASESYSQKDKDIATALLNYGAAAQLYFAHNEENLANGSFAAGWGSAINTAGLDIYAPAASGELPQGVTFYGSSLILEGHTTIRHYFKMDDATAASLTASVGGAPVAITKSANSSFYQVDITGIDAANLDFTFDLTVTDGESTALIRYSALSYAYLTLQNQSYAGTVQETLVKALYLYSRSVETGPAAGDDEFEILPL